MPSRWRYRTGRSSGRSCQETIAIITSSGPYDLVKRGDSLPWPPGGGYQEITSLVLPESSLQNPLTVRVEVVALEEAGRHILLSEMWDIPAPVEAGERIRLDYRYDENQVLDVRAFLADRGNVHSLAVCKEHPLTHISNPQVVKLRIEATEEKLRTGTIQPQERRDVVLGLAEDCAEIRQYEKAVSRLSDLLRQRNEPDAAIINRMGLLLRLHGGSCPGRKALCRGQRSQSYLEYSLVQYGPDDAQTEAFRRSQPCD
jgi:hypothetical protein